MELVMLAIRLLVVVVCAILVGKLVAKVKLPAILGWLITGMILGPHAVGILNQAVMDNHIYIVITHILECAVGLMIGTELVWSKLKKSGSAIVITTIFQSVGTFLFVSLVFGIVFWLSNIPLYLAFLFGAIALATAPAPALSIVREFGTKGPVTDTLVPMAALDDIVGCIIFFITVGITAGTVSQGQMPFYMIPLVVILPLILGALAGFGTGLFLKKANAKMQLPVLIAGILVSSLLGFGGNKLLGQDLLNFMLIGMAFSAVFANMISAEQLKTILVQFNPILGIALVIVILNLGAPLDYHLILTAGLYTAIYIVARALGKYFGAYLGASVTKMPQTVKKYLGFTLLPHSGVSLVFTGIAVSVLASPAPEEAKIIQGTIAAAAVINEIIAVIMAKKGFEWSGELNQSKNAQNPTK